MNFKESSKGFTLIEIMIVVAIIGILAAVAIPSYMAYIQKARFTSLVFPGLRTIHTYIGLYYANSNRFPTSLDLILDAADTAYFTPSIVDDNGRLRLTINGGGPGSKLSRFDGRILWSAPRTKAGSIISDWTITGTLAIELGIANY